MAREPEGFMDECDVAAELQQQDREGGLRVALRQAHKKEGALLIEGERCCLGCKEPIEPERLAANPGAARCIFCQQKHERRG
jgi:phage/conjugal plasmid C-4 type zinc finger TraR family protein